MGKIKSKTVSAIRINSPRLSVKCNRQLEFILVFDCFGPPYQTPLSFSFGIFLSFYFNHSCFGRVHMNCNTSLVCGHNNMRCCVGFFPSFVILLHISHPFYHSSTFDVRCAHSHNFDGLNKSPQMENILFHTVFNNYDDLCLFAAFGIDWNSHVCCFCLAHFAPFRTALAAIWVHFSVHHYWHIS